MLRETRVSLAKSRGLRYVQMMRKSSRGMSSRETMMNVDAGGVGSWQMEEERNGSRNAGEYLSTWVGRGGMVKSLHE